MKDNQRMRTVIGGIATTDALRDVLLEMESQDRKWGEQNHNPYIYLTILGEEYGETCQAVLKADFEGGDPAAVRAEAVQAAAVALAFIECLDRQALKSTTAH